MKAEKTILKVKKIKNLLKELNKILFITFIECEANLLSFILNS